jgi:hypothetical protein
VEQTQKLYLAEIEDKIVLAVKPTSNLAAIKDWMD